MYSCSRLWSHWSAGCAPAMQGGSVPEWARGCGSAQGWDPQSAGGSTERYCSSHWTGKLCRYQRCRFVKICLVRILNISGRLGFIMPRIMYIWTNNFYFFYPTKRWIVTSNSLHGYLGLISFNGSGSWPLQEETEQVPLIPPAVAAPGPGRRSTRSMGGPLLAGLPPARTEPPGYIGLCHISWNSLLFYLKLQTFKSADPYYCMWIRIHSSDWKIRNTPLMTTN